MTDDGLDERIRVAARDYNAPPDTPREEMWARIAEARGNSSPSGSPRIFAANSSAARPRAGTAGQDDDKRATSFGLGGGSLQQTLTAPT